ncbi:hypothetical protein [Dongia rigui]|uniref:Uncharacterized protein n=1 Tax=Dongia rigui TaxID=940149 RepID=A0ABU5E1X8_9PROT|nr:hypothetical protein [Dongia rigui]MDY0873561.1 hypothetical protein [Dongia rigui]
MQKNKRLAPATAGTEPPVESQNAASQNVVQISSFRARAGRKAGYKTLPLVCRHFVVGREDWDRGELAFVRSSDEVTRWTLTPEGALKLFDMPQGEVLIPANDVSAGLDHGLKLAASNMVTEIAAADLRAALSPVAPCSVIQAARPQFIASR